MIDRNYTDVIANTVHPATQRIAREIVRWLESEMIDNPDGSQEMRYLFSGDAPDWVKAYVDRLSKRHGMETFINCLFRIAWDITPGERIDIALSDYAETPSDRKALREMLNVMRRDDGNMECNCVRLESGDVYTLIVYRYGSVEIVRGAVSILFASGDDADEILRDVDAILDTDYPSGPFRDEQDLLDAYLSQYDL